MWSRDSVVNLLSWGSQGRPGSETGIWKRHRKSCHYQKVPCTVKTGLRQDGLRYKAATAFRNSGKYWDRNEIGKLQSSNISLSFLGIFGRYHNCKNFPVSKEVLVGDQYLSKAWGKTFWAAIKELCIRASTESEHSITLRCTRKLLVAWKQKTSLNLPTSPLEQSLR